jgi:dipeptidyl aminopeptidase/acylaminoacyl peptidase
MTTTAPYGTWRSPISASDLAGTTHPVLDAAWVDDDVWWLERLPAEGGRSAVRNAIGTLLPAPFDVRSRVHEYGGGAWAVTSERAIVFVEFSDQRLYRLDAGETVPVALTPADSGMRFGDLAIRRAADGAEQVIAVREWHAAGDLTRDIVEVDVESGAIRSLAGGSRFLAFPRFSPDGTKLAWIAWDHPQMPWDGTELRVKDLVSGTVMTLLGGPLESVLQPEWIDDETLFATTDASGWWNIVRVSMNGDVEAVTSGQRDIGGPLWSLGARYFYPIDDGRLLTVRTDGDYALFVGDDRVDIPLTTIFLGARNGDRVLLTGGSSTMANGLRVLDLSTGTLTDIRLGIDSLPPEACLPVATKHTFRGNGREVHTFVYAPHNDDFAAPEKELPPYIAHVHGGPTGHRSGEFALDYAYFTSRGIGIIEVNYGGSSGYGRDYRRSLNGEWGVVDVEDVITAVSGLADAALADPKRLAISGGSAGGFTVLAALTSSDVFAAGTSYFGVSDIAALAADTHDFESRYTDGLVAPLPEGAAIYADRSPLSHIDRLSTPVLLLQGLDDPIVLPAQAELFRDGLAEKGLPHAYVAYEGESHGFRRAETIIDAAQSELSFYGQVMGFEPPGIPRLTLS